MGCRYPRSQPNCCTKCLPQMWLSMTSCLLYFTQLPGRQHWHMRLLSLKLSASALCDSTCSNETMASDSIFSAPPFPSLFSLFLRSFLSSWWFTFLPLWLWSASLRKNSGSFRIAPLVTLTTSTRTGFIYNGHSDTYWVSTCVASSVPGILLIPGGWKVFAVLRHSVGIT